MPRLTFKKVILNNFMSYSSSEFEFNQEGFITVRGINNNTQDNAKSNGSGKSSLFSSICWCLTGETVGGAKSVENIFVEGATSVSLYFNVDNDEYIITRYKNPSNLNLIINDEDKSGKGIRDTEKLLKEYLPNITSSLLNSVIILGQGLPQRFTNNTPSGRKEVLEKLSNSDFMIEDVKNRLQKRKEYLSLEINKLSNKISEYNGKIDFITLQIDSDKNRYEELLTISYEDELENLLNEKKSIESDIKNYSDGIEELNVLINNITQSLLKIDENKSIEKSGVTLTDTKPINDEIIELKSQIKFKTLEIDKLDSITDVCPTCGQKLPNVTKIDTSQLKLDLNELKTILAEKEVELKSIEDYNSNLLSNIDKKYSDKSNDLNDELIILKSDVTNYTNILNSCNNSLSKIETSIVEIQIKLNSLEETKLNLQKSIELNTNELEKLNTKIFEYITLMSDYDARLSINTKMGTLVKRDFRGYLLTNIIEFMSNRIKSYSIKVFNTNNISFEIEGNNLNIRYDGKEYESLSGGEKQKIDVIIQLSIRDMLCKYLNFSSNILVLDEITDSLDILGSQTILNLISSELSDVECIYLISHHTDFELPTDGEVIITKGEDKISRIA